MKLLRFFDFILEEKNKVQLPTIFSKDFKVKLDGIGNSFVSSAFKKLYDDEVLRDFTLISVGSSEDTVTYVDSSKIVDYLKRNYPQIQPEDYLTWLKINNKKDTELSKLNKTEIKIGRFINKFFPNTFTDKAIEDFVNKWKSTSVDNTRFEILKGVDIKDAYKSNFYFFDEDSNNPLMNSCMNDELSLIEFYCYCSSVKCLVLLNEEGYILGRALVWEDCESRIIMDRVYYVFDKDYFKFVRYAQENGWYYKKENKSGLSQFVKDGKVVDLQTKVRVPDVFKFKEDGFPYMDTFYYAQGEWAMNYNPYGTYFKLLDTEGGYEEVVDELEG